MSNVAIQLVKERDCALKALLEGDYACARKHATAALGILSMIPDGQLAGMATQTWNRPSIVLFLEQLDKLADVSTVDDNGGMAILGYSYSAYRSPN